MTTNVWLEQVCLPSSTGVIFKFLFDLIVFAYFLDFFIDFMFQTIQVHTCSLSLACIYSHICKAPCVQRIMNTMVCVISCMELRIG